MGHRASPDFWFHYRRLDHDTRALADKCFELLENDPRHPSLRLKKVGKVWSARIGRNHRAVAIEVPDGLFWTWIGTHDDYMREIGT